MTSTGWIQLRMLTFEVEIVLFLLLLLLLLPVCDTSLQRNQCMYASATCNGFLFDGGGRRRGWGLDRRGAVSGGALQLNALNIVNALQTSE